MILNLSNLRTGGGIQVAKGFLIEANGKKLNATIHVSSQELVEFITEYTELKFVIRPKGILWRAIGNLYYYFHDSYWLTLFGPDWAIYFRLKKHVVGYAKPHPIYGDLAYVRSLKATEKFSYVIKNAAVKIWFRFIPSKIYTETHDVAKGVRAFVSSKVYVVPNVINPLLNRDGKGDAEKIVDGRLEGKDYFLYVGANYKHKNLEFLIETFLSAYGKSDEYHLVLTVPEMSKKFVNRNVHFIGSVNHIDLSLLYQNCLCVVQPSILECFSATYIEALYFGKSIIACDLPFARSILGSNAYYFDPFDREGLLLRMREVKTKKVKGQLDFTFNNENRYTEIISL